MIGELGDVVLVTGGAGFIGSNFVRHVLGQRPGYRVVNLDALTYAGNRANLESLEGDGRHVFVKGDIGDEGLVSDLLKRFAPAGIVNFAAQTHVDRSISFPEQFVDTNVLGTFRLLQACLAYWRELDESKRNRFRFLQVSTDEVYGSLGVSGHFCEDSPYAPNSPYSASKAASDHLVRAFHKTYRLPVLTVNSCNNYGPFQYPEKLIPFMILNALEGKSLPIYGDGENVRDWIHVDDNCRAILAVLEHGQIGDMYLVGAREQRTNREVVLAICGALEIEAPAGESACLGQKRSYADLMTYVADRPGHDQRYAVDPSKIERELGWSAKTRFETGIKETVRWYLSHLDWCQQVRGLGYEEWICHNYSEREERVK